MVYIISYDISDDRRRTKISKILLDYGQRKQYSLFEARLKDNQFQRMKIRILKIIEPKEDNLRIYPICADCTKKIDTYGSAPPTVEPNYFLV